MPHRIFLVEDLVTLITKELIECSYSYSKWSTVSLALTCRALEGPALSVLWARQTTLSTLIRVLPPNTLAYRLREGVQRRITDPLMVELDIVKNPSKEDWARLQRYGSWMRELRLDERHPDKQFIKFRRTRGEFTIGKNVFAQLSLAFPTKLVCSGLRELEWLSSHHWLPALRHFLSPTLTKIKIFTIPPDDPLQIPLPAIPTLPGSYLQSLELTFYPADDEPFGNSTSLTILQCGAFLERLETSAQLSEAAVSHLLGLRHLRTLRTRSDPPSHLGLPSSDIFPSLETLVLDNRVGRRWLFFLEAAQESGSTNGDLRTPVAGMKATLTRLFCRGWGGITVDPAFVSSLCIFQKLTRVFVDSSCSKKNGCTFLLTDDDVKKLAGALPSVTSLRLGVPCSANRCHTTALSLYTLSTHCPGLDYLEIHFNTTKLSHVLDRLFKGPQYTTVRSHPRCPLRYLGVGDTPISSRDLDSVVIYFPRMFHELQGFRGSYGIGWPEASRKIQTTDDDEDEDWWDENDKYGDDDVVCDHGMWGVPPILGGF